MNSTDLSNALRALLRASRESWMTHHVWSPGPDGRLRCVRPACRACEAERQAETALKAWEAGEKVQAS